MEPTLTDVLSVKEKLKNAHPRYWELFFDFWIELWAQDDLSLRNSHGLYNYYYRKRCLKQLNIPFPSHK